MTEMTEWYCTDSDCAQYMRNKNYDYFEMVQSVWLDTTKEDRERGAYEYVVTYCGVYMDYLYAEEKEIYLSPYSYKEEELIKEYGNDEARAIIAECVLETDSLNGNCVIAEFHTEAEAKAFIKGFITYEKESKM